MNNARSQLGQLGDFTNDLDSSDPDDDEILYSDAPKRVPSFLTWRRIFMT